MFWPSVDMVSLWPSTPRSVARIGGVPVDVSEGIGDGNPGLPASAGCRSSLGWMTGLGVGGLRDMR